MLNNKNQIFKIYKQIVSLQLIQIVKVAKMQEAISDILLTLTVIGKGWSQHFSHDLNQINKLGQSLGVISRIKMTFGGAGHHFSILEKVEKIVYGKLE